MSLRIHQEGIKNDAPRNRLRASSQLRIIIVVLTILLAAAASLAGLLYSSNYAPLILASVVILPVLLVVFIYKPEWALILAILTSFIPLGVLPFNIQSYANRSTVVLVFVAWLFSSIINRRKVIIPTASWLFVGFIIWIILSLAWADNFSQALTVLQTYILRWVLFLFLAVNLINTKEKLNGLMNMLAFIGLMLVIAGGVELAVNGYNPDVRFKILAMNENEMGIVALLSLTGVMWWGNQPSKNHAGIKKLLSFLYILIAILVVALSGSRGSTISMLVTIVVFSFFRPTRPWAWLTFAIIIAGLFVTPFIFSNLLERFVFTGIKGDTMLGGREGLWQAAWLLIRDNLWLGVGVGNADYAVVPYLSHHSVPSVVMPIQMWGAESDSLHNPVLTVLAETGIIGIILYLGTTLAAIIAFVRTYIKFQPPELKLYYALVASVFSGYLFSWIKGGGIQTGHSYFLMLALLLLPVSLMIQKQQDEDVSAN